MHHVQLFIYEYLGEKFVVDIISLIYTANEIKSSTNISASAVYVGQFVSLVACQKNFSSQICIFFEFAFYNTGLSLTELSVFVDLVKITASGILRFLSKNPINAICY